MFGGSPAFPVSLPTTAISFLISFWKWRCWWWSNQHLTSQTFVLGGQLHHEMGVWLSPWKIPSEDYPRISVIFLSALYHPLPSNQQWTNLKGPVCWAVVQRSQELKSILPRKPEKLSLWCLLMVTLSCEFLVSLYRLNLYCNAGRSFPPSTSKAIEPKQPALHV